MKYIVDLTSLFKAFSYPMNIDLLYLFCYDVSFMASVPSFIAMSQGDRMDSMTFLSRSARMVIKYPVSQTRPHLFFC